jgi:hypothetical protein
LPALVLSIIATIHWIISKTLYLKELQKLRNKISTCINIKTLCGLIVFCLAAIMIIAGFNNRRDNIEYLYNSDRIMLSKLYSNSPVIVIEYVNSGLISSVMEIANFQNVFVIANEQRDIVESELIKTLNSLDKSKEAIVYIYDTFYRYNLPDYTYYAQKLLQMIKDKGFEVKPLFNDARVYRISHKVTQ